jgi:REP element-mobilizing transposase RayT
MLGLASLQPTESVAAAVSKIKGQVSKWLRETAQCGDAGRLLSRGYFAMTTGQSTDESVLLYLETQGEHHGYDDRWAKPPVLVESYAACAAEDERLQAAHSHTRLQLHLVLSSWRRCGVFSQSLAAGIAAAWRASMHELKFALSKVSFVADHVHLALRVHPSVCPAELICGLMNVAQDIWRSEIDRMVTPPSLERLWQPSAYLGAYGNLASPQITAYLKAWQPAQ